jgi:hypothetical protein
VIGTLSLWVGPVLAQEPETPEDAGTAAPEAPAEAPAGAPAEAPAGAPADAEESAKAEAPGSGGEAVQADTLQETEGTGEEEAAPGAEAAAGAVAAPGTGASPEPSPIQFDLGSPIDGLEKTLGFAVDGSISGRYRFRSSPGDERDQDLYQNFDVRLGRPETDPFSAVFLGRLSEDIDGHSSGGGFDIYQDVSNSFSNNVNGRFYLGYLDMRRLEILDSMGLELVRVGRQTYDETADTVVFDGGRIDTRVFEDLAALRLTAYGGLPAHYYESSPWGDVVAGTGLELSPARRTRLRVDWTYLQDRQEDFDASDHLISAAIWQAWESGLSLHGRYNLLGDETRDYFVRGDYRNAEHDLFLQASFRQLVTTLRELPLELDRYFVIQREYRPYWQATARASKGIGESFVIDTGVDIRQLVHEEDEGLYNHEFIRYYLVPATREWPIRGMSLSVTAELWDSEEDDFFTFGGEIRQRMLGALEVVAGTYYSLYKLDRFSENEKERVRTIFGRIDYDLARNVLLSVLYEYEKDDFTTYHTLETVFTYRF